MYLEKEIIVDVKSGTEDDDSEIGPLGLCC